MGKGMITDGRPGTQGDLPIEHQAGINDDVESNKKRPQPLGEHVIVHIRRVLSKKFPGKDFYWAEQEMKTHNVFKNSVWKNNRLQHSLPCPKHSQNCIINQSFFIY